MGIMGVLKWLRKEGSRDQQRWSTSPEISRLNNEASRIKAIRAFMDRRKSENESNSCLLISNPDKDFNFKTFVKKINQKNVKDANSVIPGVPHVKSSEFFEVGWVAGTEDRYLEYVYAEWDNTRVSLKKHTHPECENAIKADLAVLTEIRHPNVVLLIATSFIEGHGLVSVFESLNCTIYNYIHEKEERISVQETIRCIRKLAEALEFAHMRGYIHGAISSHCVFLTSGIIKLGGWELTTKKNESNEEQGFENLLRAEIFRWQAPEIFNGQMPTEATDVYGLSLLTWEMATMQLPWNGLAKADIEKQYLHWKQTIPIDLYNFPSLLSKLLETGLEIDVSKRSLSINHMYKMLQRIELQYESETPIYADQLAKNNNIPNTKTLNVPVSTTPVNTTPVKKHSPSPSSSDSEKSVSRTPVRAQNNLNKKIRKSNSKRNSIVKESEKMQKTENEESVYNIRKCTDLFLEMERLHTSIETQEDLWVLYNYYEQQKQNFEIQSSNPSIVNECEKSNSTSEERISSLIYGSTSSSRTLESSDDDNFNETRNDIKKLKESLANQRERFFYGNDLNQSVSNTSTENKNTIFDTVKSKDYEPHKPASHKTSFEPKLHKTLQPELILTKPNKDKEQTFNHSCISSSIKDAVINPQLVSANHENVFESSLWRKEKMIVMSKMRKNFADNEMVNYSQDLKREISQNDQKSSKSTENDTFIINDAANQKLNEKVFKVKELKLDAKNFELSGHKINENNFKVAEQKPNKNTELSALNKNIFEISEQKLDEHVFKVPAPKLKENVFKVPESKLNKNIFIITDQKNNENISKVPEKRQSERKIANKENCNFYENFDENFNVDILNESFIEEKTLDESDKKLDNNSNTPTEKFTNEITLPAFENEFSNYQDSDNKPLKALKQALDRATEIICPSVENSLRYSSHKTFEDNCQMSTEDLEAREALFENVASDIHNNDPDAEIKSIEKYNFQGNQNTYKVKKSNALNLSELRSLCDSEFENPLNNDDEKENDDNLTLLLFSGKNHDNECNSCHQTTALARRRSLPAALGQLKAYTKMPVGKLPTLKADPTDTTFEDLYIDDEFGESLNVNMVLLENENLLDQDILPDLLELSHNSLFKR